MLKKLFMTISLCFILSSCGISETERKYAAELTPKMNEEFFRQGICIAGERCSSVYYEGTNSRVYVNVYIPEEFISRVDYSAILNIISHICIRDNINITVTFFNGEPHGAMLNQKKGTKKTLEVRYYSD